MTLDPSIQNVCLKSFSYNKAGRGGTALHEARDAERDLDGGKNLVLIFCAQLNEIVTAMLALVLSLTPLAVASLIAGAIATVDDYSKLLGDVGTLMASYFTTFAVQGRRLF